VIGVRSRARAAVFLASGACAWGAMSTPDAQALNVVKPICTVAGWVSGFVGKACSAVQNGGRFITAGKKLLTGHVGAAFKTAIGEGGSKVAFTASTGLALAAVVAWVRGGARAVLHETATAIDHTTAPQLGALWFSSTYWRVAGISAVLTLPFLFAAAIQAMVRSDLALLLRAAFGYLPLAMLAVAIAAPVTMLMLAASDQLAAIVSSTAGNDGSHFLDQTSGLVGALTSSSSSPFLLFFIGLLMVGGAMVLWLELLMRAAAVYVIVLMLPLAFAAFVWPARRPWAIRSVELLVALILSKFAIVAVLSLGGVALSHSAHQSVAGLLAGLALLLMGAFAPWALLRLLPLAEIASSAAGPLRHEGRAAMGASQRADAWAGEGDKWASQTAQMRRDAEEAKPDPPTAAGRSAVENLDAVAAHSPPAHIQAGGSAAPERAGAVAEATQPAGGDPVSPGPAEGPQAPAEAGQQARAEPAASAGDERSPGLGPMWQAKDGEWDVLTLGPEEPSPQVWPPRGDGAADANGSPRTADSPDPSPPRQPPENGHL